MPPSPWRCGGDLVDESIPDDMLPATAFRKILDAWHRSATLNSEEITRYEWFHHRDLGWVEWLPADLAAAGATIKAFCNLVRSGDIRLIGWWRDEQGQIRRVRISKAHQELGELHVFNQTLEVLEQREQILYWRVTCVEADVERVVAAIIGIEPATIDAEAAQQPPGDVPLQPEAPPPAAQSAEPAVKKRTRQQPSRPYVVEALQNLHPERMPSRDEVSDKELRAAVVEWIRGAVLEELFPGGEGVPSDLKDRDLAVRAHLRDRGVGWPISMETVRRASGRRVDKSRRRRSA
jgi:hypothetical protein